MSPINIQVHGFDLNRIPILLNESVEGLRVDTHPPILLHGWSNINLLMDSSDGQVIVKLPQLVCRYQENPYEYQWNCHEALYPSGLCSKPLAIGRLSDLKQTPFMVLEHITGQIPSRISELDSSDIETIFAFHQKFAKLRPKTIHKFKNAESYIRFNYDSILRIYNQSNTYSNYIENRISLMDDFQQSLLEWAKSMPWSCDLMHGDFHTQNIVFQKGGLLFLDLEFCALAESMIDQSYFFCEPYSLKNLSELKKSISQIEKRNQILLFAPLALLALISWFLIWIMNTEQNLIEPILLTNGSRASWIDYLSTRMDILESLLTP